MSNYNFFSPYISVPRKTNYKLIVYYVIVSVMIGGLLLAYFHMESQIGVARAEVEVLQRQVSGKNIGVTLDEVEKTKKSLSKMDIALGEMLLLKELSDDMDNFDASLLSRIENCLPNDVFIVEVNVDKLGVKLIGYGENIDVVTLFCHQLGEVLNDSVVSIESIVQDEDNYYYEIVIKEPGGDDEVN